MNAPQDHAYTQLVSAWRRREDARQSGDLRELATARFRLDASRAQMRKALGAVR